MHSACGAAMISLTVNLHSSSARTHSSSWAAKTRPRPPRTSCGAAPYTSASSVSSTHRRLYLLPCVSRSSVVLTYGLDQLKAACRLLFDSSSQLGGSPLTIRLCFLYSLLRFNRNPLSVSGTIFEGQSTTPASHSNTRLHSAYTYMMVLLYVQHRCSVKDAPPAAVPQPLRCRSRCAHSDDAGDTAMA